MKKIENIVYNNLQSKKYKKVEKNKNEFKLDLE